MANTTTPNNPTGSLGSLGGRILLTSTLITRGPLGPPGPSINFPPLEPSILLVFGTLRVRVVVFSLSGVYFRRGLEDFLGKKTVLPLLCLLFLSSGCAYKVLTQPYTPPSAPEPEAQNSTRPTPQDADTNEASTGQLPEAGSYHVIERGQTLWRIARLYHVELSTLIEVNRITDVTNIPVGTRLWIPGLRPPAFEPTHTPNLPSDPMDTSHSMENTSTGLAILWPVDGALLSHFGSPRSHGRHKGIDIGGGAGTPIRAAATGTVSFSGTMRGYGRVVMIDHPNGWRTVYAHNQKNLVEKGDVVSLGDVIAKVGRSGNATTDHCHFELRLDNRAVDPIPYLGSAGS